VKQLLEMHNRAAECNAVGRLLARYLM